MSTDYAVRLGGFLPTPQELEEFAAKSSSSQILNAFDRMRTWFNLLHDLRGGQETSVLIAAAHSKLIEIWILVPLGLLHSSYTALRTVVDICTSYTFYCSHPVEWLAVCEDRAGWESRGNIIDWHMEFTPTCRKMQKAFGLKERLNRDYQELSSYVHGVPVAGLPTLRGIERTAISDQDLEKFTQIAIRADYNLNLLFLSVFHQNVAALSARDFRTIIKSIERKKLAAAGIVLPGA